MDDIKKGIEYTLDFYGKIKILDIKNNCVYYTSKTKKGIQKESNISINQFYKHLISECGGNDNVKE